MRGCVGFLQELEKEGQGMGVSMCIAEMEKGEEILLFSFIALHDCTSVRGCCSVEHGWCEHGGKGSMHTV